MEYEFTEMFRVLLMVGGAALLVFSIALMIVLYDMAEEAREWFRRENRRAREQQPPVKQR